MYRPAQYVLTKFYSTAFRISSNFGSFSMILKSQRYRFSGRFYASDTKPLKSSSARCSIDFSEERGGDREKEDC